MYWLNAFKFVAQIYDNYEIESYKLRINSHLYDFESYIEINPRGISTRQGMTRGSFFAGTERSDRSQSAFGRPPNPDVFQQFSACFTLFYILFGCKITETHGTFAAQFFFGRKSINLIEGAMISVMPNG